MKALRLMLYDRTCTTHQWGLRWPLGLTHAWQAGGPLYRRLRRIDAFAGASSWEEGLSWLATVGDDPSIQPIQEVQFWGHGTFGRAKIADDHLTVDALEEGHRLRPLLDRIAARMAPDGQWWFRTCDTFGGAPGHTFARRWADFMGCAVAGHTYVIGVWQSGLHRLRPGEDPHWSPWEGIRQGTPEAPRAAFGSSPMAPHTIHCLDGRVPSDW